jgi:hypothetical protein
MNSRSVLRFGAVIAVGAAFVAACTSAATTAPSIAIPSAPASLAIPSIAIPSIAIPSIAIPSGSISIPSFSFPSEDKDLEGRLPNVLNGTPLQKISLKGSTFLSGNASNQQDLVDFLTALGKSPNDMSVAFAADPTNNLKVQLGAFKVNGVDSNALLNGYIAAAKQSSPQSTITSGSVGGRNVTEIVDPSGKEAGTAYVYANGDTLFYVLTADPALAATALQALP